MSDYKAAIDLLLLGIEHKHDNLRAFYDQKLDFLINDDLDDDLEDLEDEHPPLPELFPAEPVLVPVPVPVPAPFPFPNPAPAPASEATPCKRIAEYRDLMRINGKLDLELPLPGSRRRLVVLRPTAGAEAEAEEEPGVLRSSSFAIALRSRRLENAGEGEIVSGIEDEGWVDVNGSENGIGDRERVEVEDEDDGDDEGDTWSTEVRVDEDGLLARLWTLFDFCRAFVAVASWDLVAARGRAGQRSPREVLEVSA